MSKPLSKPEQDFLNQIKDHIFKAVSFTCIDKLKDFNDCRETGIKKDKKLKAIKDEEVKYYEVTKGCYDEYESYYKCVNELVKQTMQSKEISQIFYTKKNGLSFTRKEFMDMLLKDYKLI